MDYAVNGENAAIINQVNQPYRHFDQVVKLVQDRSRLAAMCEVGSASARRFAGSIAYRRYCREITQPSSGFSLRKKAERIGREIRRPRPGRQLPSGSDNSEGKLCDAQSSPVPARQPDIPAWSDAERRLANLKVAVNGIYDSQI